MCRVWWGAGGGGPSNKEKRQLDYGVSYSSLSLALQNETNVVLSLILVSLTLVSGSN